MVVGSRSLNLLVVGTGAAVVVKVVGKSAANVDETASCADEVGSLLWGLAVVNSKLGNWDATVA